MIKKIKYIKILVFVFLLLVSIPLIIPFFQHGYFPTHDGEWAVVRLADMFRTIKDFQFPPRYSGALNFGYGYPLFNFAYPFPYYLGLIFYFPIHSFIGSVKLVFAVSVILSALFMYMASYELWKNRFSAVFSAVVYIYLPYRMVDLYVRGSIGESLSFVIFPLIFYFSLKLFNSPFNRITVTLLSICVACLILTHNIMAVLFMPLLISFIIARVCIEKRWDTLQSFILSIFLGIGLSFYFWFPALFEKGNILLSQIPIADRNLYFVNFWQLLMPSWGYGTPTEKDGFTYQLGIVQVLSVVVVLAVLFFSGLKKQFFKTPAYQYAVVLIVIYLLYLTMLFPFTNVVWKNVPLLKEINYPWTMLSQLGFLASVLAGFAVLQNKALRGILVLGLLVSSFFVYQYARPQSYVQRDDNYYLTNEATTTSSSELMPLWVKDFPTQRYTDKVEILSGKATISNLIYTSKDVKFNYEATEDTVLRVNTLYYPGWHGYINNEVLAIDYKNAHGVMDIKAPASRNYIHLVFSETAPRNIANIVSIGTFLVILLILLRPLLKFR